MILSLSHVLTLEELGLITSKLNTAEFLDGKVTAGQHARLVKNNTQLATQSLISHELNQIVSLALQRNSVFRSAVIPKKIRYALFCRYEAGMSYGTHIDNALMTDGQSLMRSDVSLTLFLSSPQDYEGGELTIESASGTQTFKLAAGSMVIYPASTLHRVAPVTKGIRLVAVTWIQSLVRDPNNREMLLDLDTARQALFEKYGENREFDLISKTHANLLRKWIEL